MSIALLWLNKTVAILDFETKDSKKILYSFPTSKGLKTIKKWRNVLEKKNIMAKLLSEFQEQLFKMTTQHKLYDIQINKKQWIRISLSLITKRV